MNKRLKMTALFAALSLATAAVYAADNSPAPDTDGPRHGHHMQHGPRASMERVAVGNVLAQNLAVQTGKPAADILAMLKDQGPRETAEALGLDRDAMRTAMQTAHQTVIEKAVAAQLITAEQAQSLTEARAEHTGWHGGKRDGKRGNKDGAEGKDL